MSVAVDASVLIFFAKLKRIDLFLKLFGRVFASSIVFDEIMRGEKKGFSDCLEVASKVNSKNILIVNIKAKNISGEESTVIAAKEKKLKIVLMDDFAGIQLARFHGLKVYSCPFILLKALKEKFISKNEFEELLNKLLSYNYFISPALMKKIIELSQKL